ncbi:hypothetical protein [Streptomyces canus]|uniref:hypothetical protein n=1 Tax=Streptomyces canus TaxID=58343 RepID=UPI0036E715A2
MNGPPIALWVMVVVAGLADVLALPAAIWWTELRRPDGHRPAGPPAAPKPATPQRNRRGRTRPRPPIRR